MLEDCLPCISVTKTVKSDRLVNEQDRWEVDGD